MADYKISLGVVVDTSDIQTQINGVKNSIQPIKVDIDLNHTQSQVNKIKSQIQGLNNIKVNLGTMSGSGRGARNSVNEMNWAYKQMLDIQKKANSLSLRINSLDTSKNVNELKELSLQFARLRSDYEVLKKVFGSQLSATQFGNLQAEVDETIAKLSAMDAKFADTKARLSQNITGSFGNYDAQLISLENRFSVLANKPTEVRAAIDSVGQALKALKNANGADNLIAANEQYLNVLKQTEAQLKKLELAEKGTNSKQQLATAKEAAMRRLNSLFSEGSAAAKKYGADVERLRNEINNCSNIQGIRNVNSQINALGAEIKNTHIQTQTFGEKLKTQFSRYSSYLSVASIIMYSARALRDMFNQVVAIDTAMTELKKVTNETDAAYNQFLGNAASRAKEIGTTIDGLVNSTADFARLGYSFKESQGLAEVANIYAVVGDEVEGVEGATQSLISTMAAFKDEMNDMSDSDFAMSIIDKMNEVGNNFAISSGGIGEALQRSASSMAAANNTLDETIALITAANVVAQNPEKVGKWLCRLKKWLYRLNS